MDENLLREFKQLSDDWGNAIVSNDPRAIGSFMSDDWIIVGQTGVTTKADFLRLVESGKLTHGAMEGEIVDVRPYGDVVIVTARGTNNGTWKGMPFESDEWITDVFVMQNGRWLAVHTHLTPAASE